MSPYTPGPDDRYVGFRTLNNTDFEYTTRMCSRCDAIVFVNRARITIIDQMTLICDGCAGTLLATDTVAELRPGSDLDS